MNRFTRGLEVAKLSFKVLAADKRLLLFPLLSIIVCLLIIIPIGFAFLTAVHAANTNPTTTQSPHSVLNYVLLFITYMVLYSIIIFFNTALAANILAFCRGEKVSLSYGLGIAIKRLGKVITWAIVSSTIGVILHALEQRSQTVVAAITRIIVGATWLLLTYFVIPVMVVENVGPFAAIKISAGIIKKRWGESATLVFSLGLVGLIGFLICLVPTVIAAALFPNSANILIGIALSALLYLLLMLLMATLSMIVRCVLFYFSTQDKAPMGFDERLLEKAFK